MLLDEDDFRSFYKLLNSGMFCFFYNCVWQSRYSEVNIELLHQYGSPGSCLSARNFLWILIHIRVSPFFLSAWFPRDQNKIHFSISLVDSCPPARLPVLSNWGFWYWLGLLGVFTTSSNIRIQIAHPIIFVGNFRWWSRWHLFLLVYNLFRFHQNRFRDTIGWECIVEADCVRSCLIELQSFSLSKLNIDQYTVSWCLFHFCLYDVRRGLDKSSSCGSLWFLSMGLTAGKNTIRLSFPARILSYRY